MATDLTDALQSRLAGIDGARVRAWSANAPPPARVFDGSVTTAGDRLELHVRLVDTATGGTVWPLRARAAKAYEVLSGGTPAASARERRPAPTEPRRLPADDRRALGTGPPPLPSRRVLLDGLGPGGLRAARDS